MDEFISKSAFLEKMSETPRYFDIKYDVLNFPPSDVKLVTHGHWDDSFDGITPFCSVCRRTHLCINRTPEYCPHCGAKMDEDYRV